MTLSKTWQFSFFLLVLMDISAVLTRPTGDIKFPARKKENKTKVNNGKPPAWAMSHGEGKTRKGFLDGDILLDNDTLAQQLQALGGGGSLSLRTAVLPRGSAYLWPNGIVPYEFDGTFDSYPSTVNAILSAMTEVERFSCVRFQKKTNADSYWLRFTRGAGCSSYVGRLQAGQPVSIGATCDANYIILHELYHALGFFHTSSRPDRDSYVIVYRSNIITGYEHNFDRYTDSQVETLETPFDFNSLMQLHRKSWSKNGLNTIESRRGPSVDIGGAKQPSDIDKQMLNDLYNCNRPGCHYALGMTSKKIKDSQVTAYSHAQFSEPYYARLHRMDGAWCASSNAYGEWLQINFKASKKITGIATQGKVDLFDPAWVKEYRIMYTNGYYYWYNGGQILPGNFDTFSVQYNQFSSPFTAFEIRIFPLTWKTSICMRVELYGC